jgi:hypothetical protein
MHALRTRVGAYMGLRLILCVFSCLPVISWADVFVRDDIILSPTPERFSVCHGNGCKRLSEVKLQPRQWVEIVVSFYPPAESGAAEREQVRVAIAKFERFVGAITGTSADRGRNARSAAGSDTEMDCIDESINTSIYLTILARQGLLRQHDVQDRATRGGFISGWPHTTAVIRDGKDGSLWAVDSWFLDNGEPPFIIPLGRWRAGWQPETQ